MKYFLAYLGSSVKTTLDRKLKFSQLPPGDKTTALCGERSLLSETIHCNMSNEVVTVEFIKKEAQSFILQWDDIASVNVKNWFSALVKAKWTCKEFILVRLFPPSVH